MAGERRACFSFVGRGTKERKNSKVVHFLRIHTHIYIQSEELRVGVLRCCECALFVSWRGDLLPAAAAFFSCSPFSPSSAAFSRFIYINTNTFIHITIYTHLGRARKSCGAYCGLSRRLRAAPGGSHYCCRYTHFYWLLYGRWGRGLEKSYPRLLRSSTRALSLYAFR